MKRFLRTEIGGRTRGGGIQQRFAEALYTKGELRLEYESVRTRNAAETFDARTGNCLSLVIMTAALAKEIGLPVRYQRVYVDDTWSRSGDVYFSVGHVNLSLGRRQIDGGFGHNDSDMMTIDFLPPRDLRGVRTQELEERNDRGDVHEQPRRGIVHPRTARRRLLVGARGHREGPGLRRRRTTRSA